ncbi:mitochondrial ribosome-associated GTPase 1 isoform X3 [Calonectris borealis]|uniref:mitochondrial ribosome-associated GTPase 1 isoform X3 n=1 Tax=Calonectris borealis TaxID=1323832 RepID=UPI003F4C47B0
MRGRVGALRAALAGPGPVPGGFRERFDFGGRDVASWFPGHMAKGLRQMRASLRRADCLIEVHDARIPLSGRNPMLQEALGIRPHILVLNKTDLADPCRQPRVLERLKQQGCSHVVFTDCQRDSNVKKVTGQQPPAQPCSLLPSSQGLCAISQPHGEALVPHCEEVTLAGPEQSLFPRNSLPKAPCPLLGPHFASPPGSVLRASGCRQPGCRAAVTALLRPSLQIVPLVARLVGDSPRYHRAESTEYSILVIGVPNVGKSSLINSLRRLHLKKGKATAVGGEPGITKAVLTRIQVCEKPLMYLVDTPGVLPPKLGDVETGMKLALCGAIRDHLVGEDIMADYLLYALNKQQQFGYVQRYGLAQACDDIEPVLRRVALAQGRTQKVKVLTGTGNVNVTMLNYPAAAYEFLRDFRAGRLGRVTLD